MKWTQFAVVALLCLSNRAWGQTWKAVPFEILVSQTTAVESVSSKTNLTGRPLGFSFYCPTSAWVTVRTVPGFGLSTNASRAIVAWTNTTSPGFYHALPEAENKFLWQERVEMVVTGALAPNKRSFGKLLYEAP